MPKINLIDSEEERQFYRGNTFPLSVITIKSGYAVTAPLIAKPLLEIFLCHHLIFEDLEQSPYPYIVAIEKKVKKLLQEYAAEQFTLWLEQERISCEPAYSFSKMIAPIKFLSNPVNCHALGTPSAESSTSTFAISIETELILNDIPALYDNENVVAVSKVEENLNEMLSHAENQNNVYWEEMNSKILFLQQSCFMT